MLRLLVHAVVAVFALSAFGVEVCPHLAELGVPHVMRLLIGFIGIGVVVRFVVEDRVVGRAPLLSQPARQLWLDLGVFVGAALCLMVFDRFFYGYPWNSGVRIVVGCVTLGLFAGLDTALARERAVLQLQRQSAGEVRDQSGAFFSLSRKFAAVAIALFTLLTADLCLLGMKDLTDLLITDSSHGVPQRELMIESIVALAVVIPLLLNLVVSFARNLRLFLDNQRDVLEAVAAGRLDVVVPIASNDEFAVIASRTNQMIAGLRERKRIQELVGKLVSPAVAEQLLAQKDGWKLGGTRRKVVVLFSDVRNFTTRTERADPEELVHDLNAYFTEMVDVVHAHGGVVDKFIGDGMMAIFGLERFDGAASDAVLAAQQMHRRLEALNRTLKEPIAIGIGIHAGEVVAGTIGSPDRLEFTFIGDAVNAAARIEGLTKELQASPLVSSDVKDALSGAPSTWAWAPAGEQALKGKETKLTLYRLGV